MRLVIICSLRLEFHRCLTYLFIEMLCILYHYYLSLSSFIVIMLCDTSRLKPKKNRG